MATHKRLRWGAVALVLLSVALVCGSHLCGVALEKESSDPGMRPIGAGALACTEFWLNRYQTLLGAFAALFAGYLAWRGAIKQSDKAQSQIELMQKQTARESIDYINESIGHIDPIFRAMVLFQKSSDKCVELIKSVIESRSSIFRMIEEGDDFESHYERVTKRAESDFEHHREKMSEALQVVQENLRNVFLTDDLRKNIADFVNDGAAREKEVGDFCSRINTRINVKPEFVTEVRSDCERIMSASQFEIHKIDFLKKEASVSVMDRRNYLLEWRADSEILLKS